MSGRTIGSDGLDEPAPRRPHEQPVDYLIVLRAKLTAEQAAEFEVCDEVILRHPKQPVLIRAQVRGAEVIE